MKSVKFIFILKVIIFLIGCNYSKNEIQEYNANLNEDQTKYFINKYSHQKLSEEEIKDQIKLDNYILNYAQNHKLDTVAELNLKIEYALRFFNSQVDGFMWNKEIKPKLYLTDKIIIDAYNLKKKKYTVKLIEVKDTSSNFYSNQYINNNFQSESTLQEFDIVYPFNQFNSYIENIENSTINDVLGPINNEAGTFLLKIIKIENNTNLPNLTEHRNDLAKELLESLKNRYVKYNIDEIIQNTDPVYNPNSLKIIAKMLNEDIENINQLNDFSIMEYSINQKRKKLTAHSFLEYLKYQPVIIGNIKSEKNLRIILKNYLVDTYLYQKTIDMNYLNDKNLLLEKKWITSKIYNNYFNEILKNDIVISNEVITKYYNDNISLFKTFKTAEVEVYYFKNWQDAVNFRNESTNQSIVLDKETFFYNVTKPNRFFEQLDPIITKLEINEFSYPIHHNTQYIILRVNNKRGEFTYPLQLVKEKIHQELKSKVLTKKIKNIINKSI